MAQTYDYDEITPVSVSSDLFATKPKPTPRKPLPAALTEAIAESAATGEPRAFQLPADAGEKAALNLVNRIRDYADKNGGYGVRSKVTANEGGWEVAFKLQPKRVRGAAPQAEQGDLEHAEQLSEELTEGLDSALEDAIHIDSPEPEAPPVAERPKRTRAKK